MSYFLLILSLALAIIDWVAVHKDWTKLEYFAKPGVMLALIAWFWQNGGSQGHAIWFGLGLVFSLTGDIFLLLPREQFIAGLVAFLMGHLAYVAGFNPTPPPFHLSSLLLALLVGLAAFQIYRRIEAGLLAKGLSKLRMPVLVYSVVISLMLWSALLTLVRQEWAALASLAAAGGAMLFFLSDTLLAWNRFVAPFRLRRLPSMVTYHLGQVLIALGVILRYLE